jgi:serine/threonine protein phosphatase PrpC
VLATAADTLGHLASIAASPSRRGKAVRLTYDHKGSDQQEAKRITDAGGFVMNNRVNGACGWRQPTRLA